MGIIFKQSFKNTLIIYLGFLIGGINTLFLYTRILKDEYYGLTTYVLSSSNLIMPLTAFGVHYTIVKFFSSYKTKEQKDKFLSSIVFLPLLIALPIGYFWSFFHDWLMESVSEKNKIVESYTIYIYIIAVCCAYFEVFYSWAKVQMQSVFGNILKELYNRLSVMVLLCVLYFNFITKQEFIQYLSYAYILRVFIMMFYAFKLYLPKFSLSLPNNYKEVLKYTSYIILAGSASAVVLDIDKFMIGGKDTFHAAAYYTVAVFIGSFIEAPSRAMTQILQPITSKSLNDNNKLEVLSLYKKSSINLLIVGGLFFILVNTNVTELFRLMPNKGYAGGQWVVLMISSAKLFNMLLGNNGAIISNSNLYKITLFTGFGMALLVWLLNTYFYYDLNYGTEGLALSTMLSVMFFGFFKLWYVNYRLKMHPFTKQTIIIIGTISIAYLSFQFWNFNSGEVKLFNFSISPIINIILKSILIIPIYVTIVYQLKISKQFNGIINKLIKR
ncbi:lipopolysaccharide biosynthesis protein [Tenacibaculum sp. 190524A02b]|uniref:Sugar isomerase n=1 Tax=Tenacibaculum vairaonense TaxID=3137860 RepID=A0ABM9PHN1_9FLAO